MKKVEKFERTWRKFAINYIDYLLAFSKSEPILHWPMLREPILKEGSIMKFSKCFVANDFESTRGD